MAITNSDGSIILNTKVDTKGLNSGMSSIKGAVTKLGGIMAAVFSVKLLMNFAKETTNLYKIQMQNEVKLATVMRQRMKATDEQIKQVLNLASAEQKLGIIGDEVQLAGLQQVATFATQKETLEALLPAMNNLIAQQYGYEASVESARNVANMMGKALQGQIGALSRVGITFSEAEANALKMGNEMERAATLAKIITNNVGEMNYALAQTDVGRQRQLANVWGDIKEQFGAAFTQIAIIALPALNAVAKALAWVADLARMVAQTIANMFGMKSGGGSQKSGIGGLAISTGSAAEGMSDLGNATEEAGKQAKKALAGFDDLQILTESASTSAEKASEELGGIGSGIGGEVGTGFDFGIQAGVDTTPLENALKRIGDVLKTIWESTPIQTFVESAKTHFETLGAFVTTIWGDIKNNAFMTWQSIQGNLQITVGNLAELWTQFWSDFNTAIVTWRQPIINSISTLFNSIWETAIEPAVKFITQMWADFTGILLNLWNEHGATLLNNVGEFIHTIIGLFQSIYDNVLEPIITPFLKTLSWLWEKHLSKLVYAVGDFVMSLVNGALEIYNKFIAPIVKWFVKWLAPSFVNTFNTIVGVISSVVATIVDVATAIITNFTGIIDFITGVFTGNWKKAWDGVTKVFKGILDYWKGLFKGVINVIIDMINGLTGGWSAMAKSVSNIPGFGWADKLKIPKIPRLAQGAVIPPNREFLAVLGDQKQGTNIEAPLQTIVDAFNMALAQNGGRSGSTEVVLEIDGREFGRAVVEQGNRENRRIGTRLVVI